MEGLFEFAVYQNVYILKQCGLFRVFQQSLKCISGVTPDVFPAFFFDGSCQLGEFFRLKHRVAPAESYVCKIVCENLFQYLFSRNRSALIDIPRFRVMATRTLIWAAGSVDSGPESRTVYSRIFYNINNR